MKRKESFVLRKMADFWVMLSLKTDTVNFDGMLTLNESGAMLWQALEKDVTREDLANVLTKTYDVPFDQALADVDEFLEKLTQAGCLED